MKNSKRKMIKFILVFMMFIFIFGQNVFQTYAKDYDMEDFFIDKEIDDSKSEETLMEEITKKIVIDELEPKLFEEKESENNFTEEIVVKEDNTSELMNLEAMVPNVRVCEAFDKYISLELGISEDVMFPENKKFSYEVKVVLHKENEKIENVFLFEKKDSHSQKEIIKMEESMNEESDNWTYDIEVKLIEKQEENDFDIISMESSQSTFVNAVAVKPYYETKISLKKKTTKIYTTQTNVPVAVIKFGKETTEKENIKVEDITYNGENNQNQALKFSKIGGDFILYASADEDTALGKHIVKITADAPIGVYASQTTITINVVQGIEEGMLSLSVPSQHFYKAEGKNISFTAKALYTKDLNSNVGANQKKVSWEIVSTNGKPLNERDYLYDYITLKNGKVTINKKYTVSEQKDDNCFKIKISAADFAENTVCVYSEVIEITNQIEEIGEVFIIQIDENGNGFVTARNESSITADKLGQIIVLKKEAPIKEYYTNSELSDYTFRPESLTYKCSNNFIKIDKEGNIVTEKPVKNVKITVMVNDNSKQKAVLNKLSVVYETPESIGLKIEKINKDGSYTQIGKISSEDADYEFNEAEDTRLKVTVMQKKTADSEWEEVNSHVNFNISVKVGKLIKKAGQYNQYFDIGMNSPNLIIKLNDKSQKEIKTYTIINNSYPTGKAPKLYLKGSLQEAAYEKEQNLTYALKKNGNFKYDSNGKYVFITANASDKYKNDKKISSYMAFEKAMGGLGYYEVKENKISLKIHSDEENPLYAGNYKLWFTFGSFNKSGKFIPDTKMTAVNITVKKVNLPKGSYKPIGKYNISVKEGGTVKLKGNGQYYKKDSVDYSNLINANVKGSPNAFNEYFEINDNVLKLKNNLSEKQIEYICSDSGKKDLNGYVDCKVNIRNSDGSYSEQISCIKINLTMKESVRKYEIKTVKAEKKNATLATKAYADKKEVNILFAYVASGSYDIGTNGSSSVILVPKTGDNAPVWGINNLTIYVVPEGTYEPNRVQLEKLRNEWNNAEGEAKETARKAFVKAIKKYGIKVEAKVELPTRTIENREFAEEVVSLVNKEREKAGLKALSIDENTMYAAYVRAKEINKLFSHTRPDGSSCFTVLSQYEVYYMSAGENIAMGYPSPQDVVTGWMNSPGHRANILNSSFTHIGVGCYEANGYYHWVQLFIGKPN